MNDKGILYVVATPIGNLNDITLRAIETLKKVDLVACEDTRVTGVLLNHLGIKKQMIAINEFNEEQIVYEILSKLENCSIALVSDAGTPLISDPGYRLVNEAKRKGFKVVPIPGVSALIAALSASGLPTDKFVFLGFLPKTEGKAVKAVEYLKDVNKTIILYESPHRVVKTLEILKKVFGDINVVIARELTKIYEEIFEMKISDLLEKYKKTTPKGEFVLLFKSLPR